MNRHLVAPALFFLACSQPAAVPQQPGPPGDRAQQTLTQRCTNAQSRFSVSYPADWKTNDGSVLPACSVFDPDAIELPRNSEIPFGLAVVIGAQDAPFDANVQSSQFEKVLSSARLTVAGRAAVRVEVESTGEGLADRGMRTVRYVVDLGSGRTLVATTHDADGDYAANQGVLSRMMETLAIP